MRSMWLALSLFAAPAVADDLTISLEIDGDSREYAARIDRPDEAVDNGFAVMLIGGGGVTDLHWTVPASYTDLEGNEVRFTTDGEPTRDADAIAARLTEAGFMALRFSSVYVGDPVHAENAAMATPMRFGGSVRLAREAKRVFAQQGAFEPGRLFLLGHSLGALRAAHLADDDVAGLVFLAGAYTSKMRESSNVVIERAFDVYEGLDGDGDALIARQEWRALGHDVAFDQVDVDGDGVVRGWELAAFGIERGEVELDAVQETIGDGPWPADVIRQRGLPVLMLFGGLDPISVHAPWVERFSEANGLGVRVRVISGLGHQLSVEDADGLIDDIDPGVLGRIAGWLRGQIRPHSRDDTGSPASEDVERP